MSKPVMLKSNKYGINLILDSSMDFEELLDCILERFKESEGFLKTLRWPFLLRAGPDPGRGISDCRYHYKQYICKHYLYSGQ